MRNFIIVFEEKEGTSPLVRLLDRFEQVSIVHQVDDTGWEPFDQHNCGPMRMADLRRCLDLLYRGATDLAAINEIYVRTGARPLEAITATGAVGFKMRFLPPRPYGFLRGLPRWNAWSRRWISQGPFQRMMFDLFERHDVVVFVAVRQDVLRWALSKYHGDGTGRPGHIQFDLARGALSRKDIPRIHVDCGRLASVVSQCEASHAMKRRLIQRLRGMGIEAQPLLYEQFLADKVTYFRRLLTALGFEISDSEIESALSQGAYFEKVHSEDLAGFVENHTQVLRRFGGRFVAWE